MSHRMTSICTVKDVDIFRQACSECGVRMSQEVDTTWLGVGWTLDIPGVFMPALLDRDSLKVKFDSDVARDPIYTLEHKYTVLQATADFGITGMMAMAQEPVVVEDVLVTRISIY